MTATAAVGHPTLRLVRVADEAAHAWYWTDCIDRVGARPMKLSEAYQDQYLEAAGLPAESRERGIDQHVRFKHKVVSAAWSSETSRDSIANSASS